MNETEWGEAGGQPQEAKCELVDQEAEIHSKRL